MITASIYGRLGKDPKPGTTKAGKPMTTVNIAVDVGRSQEEPETLWVSLMAFGLNAEALAQHTQGDMVAATGKLTRGRYVDANNQERESWSLMVDALHSSRTVRPGQRRQANGGQYPEGNSTTRASSRNIPLADENGVPFDDVLDF